ncbi:MAG TPA: mechanosensitive ion channel family protein [Bacteroides mediterraneensis]|uniref:mechanosensitive ion channel family protein n=1 Tax=Bacteroides mediterraneensis TaxID=1841856 RepID=UPI0026103A7B|nr:mechanosensitive ion channel domain-containing protein [Bacteroides mediterraneensis]HJH63172.1 mechanosensitive ion channel family protein [Bacteroides mediterraneensis]
MNTLNQEIAQFLQQTGIEKNDLSWSTQVVLILAILLISYLTTLVFRHLIMPAVRKITARTKATWDDYLFNDKMMTSFCRMIPPIIWYILLPFAFNDSSAYLLQILLKISLICLIITALMLIKCFLDSLYEISSEHEALKNRPLKGIYQMINLVAIGIGIILIISILIDQNATAILTGLGASAAILMLIFKDSILGLVAGVQLSANDMLRPGDWITMTKYGADGYVVEVSLTTVKVQNFDKTITTIPPYALVSDSFQNWRGMRESGGRRIKRSLFIDMTTVHFCTPEEVARFTEKGWISAPAEGSEPPVNLHVFREYALKYICSHPDVNHDLMQMVRQLQPTTEGIPVEVYCFSNTPDWIPYETLQGELFDHLIAMVPEFGLHIFQRPAGTDFQPNDKNEFITSK